ncbi:MAG: peptide chain release factor-like protein [Candidatus Altiarchaeales archaeon]|nr:peptide chain release factor-like protein [Candidatus Altiarchaeales archaeon]
MSVKKKRRWFSITAKDCEFQTYRGSGKGGQHRNKTDSAVRCIHPPSGAVGTCEEHKEQKQNKRTAFKRMAESKEFQSWINLKIDAGLGRVEIEMDGRTRLLTKEEV